jgi:hypothetical protein
VATHKHLRDLGPIDGTVFSARKRWCLRCLVESAIRLALSKGMECGYAAELERRALVIPTPSPSCSAWMRCPVCSLARDAARSAPTRGGRDRPRSLGGRHRIGDRA